MGIRDDEYQREDPSTTHDETIDHSWMRLLRILLEKKR